MDALSDVLRVVRLTGAVFLDAQFTAPWCIEQPSGRELCARHMPEAQHVVLYHLVTEGACAVRLPGHPPLAMEAGDLVVVPGGDAHVMGSDLGRKPVSGTDLIQQGGPDELPQIQHGGGGAATRMVCGYLACDSGLFDTILAALPRVMTISMREGPGAQWIASSIRFSIAESAAPRAGAAAVLAKLSELMFVEAIRRHIESLPPEQTGWLAGLRDRFVAKALALIHSQPAHPWTVEELSGRVGLSRSAFSERFTGLVGHPPVQYLTRWRLQLAADRLRSGSRSVLAVALEVGYDSEAAFARAFKRELGVTPAAWRRTAHPRVPLS